MRKMRLQIKVRQLFLLLLSTLLLATPSLAALVTVDLKAEARPVVMPDGTSIDMWGFFDQNDNGTSWAPVAINGLNAGDDLTVNLTNNLAEDVSIVITGQNMNFMPTRVLDSQGRERVHSLAPAVAAAGTGSFSWTNLKAGTFLLQSGSHPAKQVQMGMYGSVVVAGYSGIAFDNEVLFLYSEIDPALHVPPSAAKPLNYKPKYFLINGQPYMDGQMPIAAGAAGQALLIRLLNAGLKTHVPMLLNGPNMRLIAEDGNLYPYPRNEYSALMGPGKTIDALWMPTADGVYPLVDRSNYLTSNGIGNGGMLTHLSVGGATAADTVIILRTRFSPATQELRVWANSTASPGATLTLFGHGVMPYVGNINSDYRFFAPGVVSNPGVVSVASDQGGSDTQSVAYTAAPVAVGDAYTVDNGATINIAASGVLTNDSKGGYFTAVDGLAAQLVTGPTHGTLTLNPDGSFDYTHNGSITVSDRFTYVTNAINTNTQAVLASSAPVTVVLNINWVNAAPVAVLDTVDTTVGSGSFLIDLIANDFDPDGTIDAASTCVRLNNYPASCVITTPRLTRQGGNVVNNYDGTVLYNPPAGFVGTDIFHYRVKDNEGADSDLTQVRINIAQ